MTATQRPTVLLIGGTGRSGSTLLDRLLGELPGFVAVGELRYIWSEALGENRYCGCGARFLDCPFWSKVGSRAFGGWDRIDPNQVMAQERSVSRHRHIPLLAMGGATPGRYARRLDGYLRSLAPMYDAIREVSGADVIVDSTKDAAYAHVLRRMRGADFRVVHLVRDSRGVAWSWAKVVQSDPEHYMRRFSPPVTALRWVGYNLMVESLGRFGIPRLLLRYEDLVRSPQAALTMVASFAGRPLAPGTLAFLDEQSASLGTHHTVAGNPMRMTAGRIGLALDEAWRTSMPFAQRAQVTALTWPLLRHYAQSGRGLTENAAQIPTALEGGGQTMTQENWPSVTAVIPTRDRPELLARAVQSVLNQAYPGPLECVIVFDQQSPKMPDVKVPEDRPVRLIENDRTPGLAGARNAGAAAATSDLLAWCDDDDEWLPDKLRRQVEAMRQTPEAAVATCGICLCVGNRRYLKSPSAQGVVPRAALLRSRQAWIHSTTLLIRRDRFFGDIGPVDEAVPGSYGEDYEWVLRASNAAAIVAVPEPLVRVYWQTSYYADRWDVMISAIQYHLDKHPELAEDPRNAARMYGRLAFAYGATGMSGQARSWARRSIRLNWRQPRGYLAILVAGRLLSPRRLMSAAHAIGKGM